MVLSTFSSAAPSNSTEQTKKEFLRKVLVGRCSFQDNSVRPCLLALILVVMVAARVQAQSVFPLPGWFKQNIGRPPGTEKATLSGQDLKRLSQEGKAELTEADAVRLVLENNLDVVVDRYDPLLSLCDVEGSYRAFEPYFQFTLSAGRTTDPQTNTVTSGVEALSNLEDTANFSFSQMLQTSTQYRIDFKNFRQSSNSLRDEVNPYLSSSLTATLTQPLLRNFGLLPSTRILRINRNNQQISEYVFAQKVIDLVSQVQHLYWNLVFAGEDIKVKQRSLDLATKTNKDNQRQVEIGTLAPIEVVKSEAEIANRQEELIRSQFSRKQTEDQIKKMISALVDPGKLSAVIDPVDNTLPPSTYKDFDLATAVSYAIEARPEVKQLRKQLENGDIEVAYFRNQLLPKADLALTYGTSALAGQAREAGSDGTVELGPNASFRDNLEALFGNDYPSYSATLSVEIPIRNRMARADNGRAVLGKAQSAQSLRALEQQIALEVRNTYTQLEMNRARIDATRKARELAEQNLNAEQKKFQLGTSTIRFVLEEQRNLALADSNELQALVDFTKAKIDLDKAMGKTLEVHNIRIEETLRGGTSGWN
jgi:outer membrane protein